MSPTRTSKDSRLFDEVKSLSVLQNAWLHVRSRAVQSPDPETQRERSLIEADTLRYLRALQRDLSANRFAFEAQRAVLKKREGKKPRPIVVAPLRNRIVQRAILDVCQSERPTIRNRLGRLPEALATPTSVGGLPKKGVGTAVRLIRNAIASGATHYVRSDLHNFFACIPKTRLYVFLDENVQDPAFLTLFKAALDVELANADEDEVRKWWDLFPSADVGVPQGSALSAISANIILSSFDVELNRGDLTTVRYLDDFLILGPSEQSVSAAWGHAVELLGTLGLKAYEPGESSKAARGTVAEGFEFLSFRVRGPTVAPTREAKQDLLAQIDRVIADARRSIRDAHEQPRRVEGRFVQSLDLIDRKVRGWGDSFSDTTQRVEFHQLDDAIGRKVSQYISWFHRMQLSADDRAKRRLWGLMLLADTPQHDP